MQLLSQSWMAQAAADPAQVSQLIDAPGGDGWLKLFHGDLDGAEKLFRAEQPSADSGSSASARLGLSRVHLARARSLLVAADMQSEAASALVKYRDEHHAQVRSGPYTALLSALVRQAAGQPVEEVAGNGDRVAEALQSILEARRTNGGSVGGLPPDALPAPYRQRLLFSRAVASGDMPAAEALLNSQQWGTPDIVDPLGRDADADVEFKSLFFDSGALVAMARYHLAEAWRFGAGLDGPGELIAVAVQGGWGGPVPEGVRARALPPAGSQPHWQALFLGPAIDRSDWQAYWGPADSGRTFLSVLQEHMPGVPWSDGKSASDVDLMLRAAAGLEVTLREALTQSVGSEGASLSQDLGFDDTTLDRLFRTRMVSLLGEGVAIQAQRLGERSLDPEPTRLGGAASSAVTQVSYRNDRAFLLELARCLWQGGRAEAALRYVHPLSKEDPRLAGLAYYLGQLDAANSIGVQGKTTQL